MMPSIRGVLDRINPWYTKPQAPPPPPPMTTTTAFLLLGAYALVYFLPFYLSKATRPSPELSRDAPSAIRSRIRSVLISCSLCCLCTYCILVRDAHSSVSEALHLMGLWPLSLYDSARATLLTAGLFAGPLFAYFFVQGGAREWMNLEPLRELWEEWTTWRNIIAGPVTEEILFRSASVPLVLIARAPVNEVVFLSPVIFGLAHFHHFYEFRISNPGVPVIAALFRSLFQLAFTTVFGAYATFVFLRTGSLLAVCVVHAFCNSMGLPQIWGRITPPPIPMQPGTKAAQGVKGSLGWTMAYYVILVSGAVFWWKNLWSLTETSNALLPTSAFTKA
ncbi:hypothetical protein VTK73DRAFT_1980 [Phialemonium thermophilum]|uniref:intramembrane prenyl-peptidase Rce1 n=1 Tax=Phialemonium thermophilum TaxID=223376 RepID=A0ABR3X7G5_9PEZI